MINEFLDWAQQQQNGMILLDSRSNVLNPFAVWIVSSEQLLAWVQNPKPISQMDQVDAEHYLSWCEDKSVKENFMTYNGP